MLLTRNHLWRDRAWPLCCIGGWLEYHLEAEPGELSDQMPGFGLKRAGIEVVGSEIVMRGAPLQHVVDGREDGSGKPAPAQAAAQMAFCGPRRLCSL